MAYYKCGQVYVSPNSNVEILTASGAIANFSTDLALPLKSCKVEIKPKQAASANPPSPSNPLPISGTDTVIVTQTGANLWDETWEVGNINTSGEDTPDNNIIRTKGYISIKPSTSYYAKIASSPYSSCRIFYYDQNKNFIEYKPLDKNLAFTTVSGAFYCRIRFATATTYNNDISINYPSTDTAYHAHVTATTKTVSLPQTVYGGEVDCIGGSGESYDTPVADLSDLTWTVRATGTTHRSLSAQLPSTYTVAKANEIIAEQYAYKGTTFGTPIQTPDNMQVGVYSFETANVTSNNIYIITDDLTLTTPQGKIYFPNSTKTPITLANPIELTAKNGVNNVFGDTADVELQYKKIIT